MAESVLVGHPVGEGPDGEGAADAETFDYSVLKGSNPLQLKAAAKNLSQTLAQGIDDRRQRQHIRTLIYRELLPLLRHQVDSRVAFERRIRLLRKTVAILAFALLASLSGLLFLLF